MGTVVQQTSRPSSVQWTQLQRSSVPLSPPSWPFSLHDAPVKLPVSWRNPPIPLTVSSSSNYQEDGTRALEPATPDCSTAFSPRLWLKKSPCPSLKPHTNPYLLKHGPSPPPNTPKLTTSQKKTETFFVQFEVCYTQVSGPVQTTCSNTLSSVCNIHFSHIIVCT